MPKGYHHLTRDQRCQIDVLKKRGESQRLIAASLGKHPSTISRELKRNSAKRMKNQKIEYQYAEAHHKSLRKRRKASCRPNKMTTEIKNIIKNKLFLQWSPEQISGWLYRHNIIKISHETIYKMVWRDKRKGGNLYKNLRHHRKNYQKRGSSKSKNCCIPRRVDIDLRPKIVEQKKRVGDWEADTIVGKGHNGAVVTMVDRASKLTKLYLVEKKTSQNVANAMISKLLSISDYVFTITADNGGEFAKHEEVSRHLDANFYFAKPYHAWERGLNEHTNGLIRQYIPKKCHITDFTQEQVTQIEDLLNNRPRKVLNYLTPIEAFEKLMNNQRLIALQS
jgi:IS30 family transposase